MAQPVSQGGTDYPDGGFQATGQVFAFTGDLGELAARLDSPARYNREGNVAFWDDFRHGLGAWKEFKSGTGTAIQITSEYACSGGYACDLRPGTTLYKRASIEHYFHLPKTGRIGLETRFLVGGNEDRFFMAIYLYDGTNYTQAAVRYHLATDKLDYLDSEGAYQDLASDLRLGQNLYNWHTIKMVIDTDADEYIRLLLDGLEYSMADIAFPEIGADPYRLSMFTVGAIGDGTLNARAIIDYVIITWNEPDRPTQ